MQKQQIPLKNSLLLLLAAIIWGIAFVAQSVGMKYVGALLLMPSVPLSEQSFWFHWFLFWKRETLLQILLPKHLADLTPQVILYPICRRKKLWLSAVSPAVSASVWQAISNSSASSIQPSEKPALSLPVILWSSLSSDYSLAKNAQNLSGCRCNGSDRTLSPVHHRWIFYRKRRSARTGMRISIFTAHTGHRLLFSKSRRSKALLHSVPDMWYPFRHSRSAPWASGTLIHLGSMAANPLRRCHVMRSSLHLADYRSEKHEPTVASLILSLESCISVLAGWIILRQQLSTKEILGCVIMFAAIILAQLPQKQTE